MVVNMLPHQIPEKPLAFKNLEPGSLLQNVAHPYQHPLKAAMVLVHVAAPLSGNEGSRILEKCRTRRRSQSSWIWERALKT